MYYLINETLTPCSMEDIRGRKPGDPPYVIIMNLSDWEAGKEGFDMVIDMDMDPSDVLETKAIVNFDSLTGSFSVPSRKGRSFLCGGDGEMDHCVSPNKGLSIIAPPRWSSFALDENGIIFIEEEDFAAGMVEEIRQTRRWKMPSLERFLYDFLELLISEDLKMLVGMEQELGRIEEEILTGRMDKYPERLNEMRSFLMELRIHYEQLIDFGQELEENENGFFKEKNLRYFRLFTDRVTRLMDQVKSLRDYSVQLQEFFSTQLEIRMNRIMTLLTVITAIFMPLTLIAGWYGMNFVYMPELKWKFGYPMVILLSLAILIGGVLWSKRKKWL